MKLIKLSQDNNWNNSKDQKGIEISEQALEYELKAYFNWRTPTKRYKSFKERFMGLGSHNHDKFINHLINHKGY